MVPSGVACTTNGRELALSDLPRVQRYGGGLPDGWHLPARRPSLAVDIQGVVPPQLGTRRIMLLSWDVSWWRRGLLILLRTVQRAGGYERLRLSADWLRH